MCATCGCNKTNDTKVIDVYSKIISRNDALAKRNRQILDDNNILCLNLMSSPGSGKTRLLETTIDAMQNEFRVAVIEGDLETENDAKRIRKKGVPAVQITTGSACHLEADMIYDAMQNLDLNNIDILFIENVGNLVCPASFDLGHHQNVCLVASTEGDDKPLKYPVMFRAANICILSKSDLLPHLDDFDFTKIPTHLRQLGSTAPVFMLSACQPHTLHDWIDWLRKTKVQHQQNIQQSRTLTPKTQKDGKRLHEDLLNEPTSTLLA